MTSSKLTLALHGVAALLLAGVVHIVSIVILPRVAPNDAYARVSRFAGEGSVRVLPRASAPGDPVPFRDPSLATAICGYDLSVGALRVTASVGDAGFVALAFHSRSGLAFYGLNDRAAVNGKLDLVLMTATEASVAASDDSNDPPLRDIRIVAPEERGFVTLDILPRIGGYAEAERDLSSMSCKVEHQS